MTGNPSVNIGSKVTFVNVNFRGITSRQWQMSTDNGSTWTDIPGATGESYITGTLNIPNITLIYRVKINGQELYSTESELKSMTQAASPLIMRKFLRVVR